MDIVLNLSSGLLGALLGGIATYWGGIHAVDRVSKNLEREEIRRQKVECAVQLIGLRWVVSGEPNVPPDYRAMFAYVLNRISALWSDDASVMYDLRRFYAHRTNETFISLLRKVTEPVLPGVENLTDNDLENIFSMKAFAA